MYAFREREKILDLFEDLTGARMMANFMRFGGCRNDLPAGWAAKVGKLVDDYGPFLDEMENLLDRQRNSVSPDPGRRRAAQGGADQRRHHRPDAARRRRQL